MGSSTKNMLESKHLTICRWCLKEDGVRDISIEYYYCGEREVYEELLDYTFSIQFSSHNNLLKTLVCEQCVIRLREAKSFKQMVIESKDMFQNYVNGLEHNEDLKLPPSILKVESIVEDHGDNAEVIYDHDQDDSFDEDEILSNIKRDLTKTENDSILSPKRKKYDPDKKTASKECKFKEDEKDSNDQQKKWLKISERRGTAPLLRENSLKLIQNSTICVFQWNKSRYRCFCCQEPFSDINLLKDHTNNAHTLKNIEKNIIMQQNRLVKVEVSSLHCKLCRENLESLTTLKEHLFETHGSVIGEDLLVPFRIESELKCQICFEKFTQFRLLNIHMNKHFQKQVCHICGAGFSSLVFLNLHKTRSHRPPNCKTCDVTFNSKIEKKNHDLTVHDKKYERKLRFPCPFCPQRFFQEQIKMVHLVEAHGMPKPEFKCSVCSKSFITKSLCNNHVKNVHKKEKKHECNVCHNFFYTKSDVARHRVTHTGEKKFCCGVCNNVFASSDSLRRHLKRTHRGINKNVLE